MDSKREDILRESWKANAAAWTGAVRGGGVESRALATDAAVLEAVLESRPRRVLDVGIGEGWLAHRLAERGVDIVGFDASEEFIARAREGGGSFHVLDYDDFARDPRLGHGFDVAACNFSLLGEHIDGLLQAGRAVLVPRGRLIIQTLHPLNAGDITTCAPPASASTSAASRGTPRTARPSMLWIATPAPAEDVGQ